MQSNSGQTGYEGARAQRRGQEESSSGELPVGNHDIFTDPALVRATVEDPLFKFLSVWWRQVLVVVAAVGLAWFAWSRFEETREARLGEYSDLASRASRQYADLQDKVSALQSAREAVTSSGEEATKKIADAELALSESKGRLEDSLRSLADTTEPYKLLTPLYSGLASVAGGNPTEALAAFGEGDWKVEAAQGGANALVAELKALAKARVLIDIPERAAEGEVLLRDLALGGTHVYVGAAVTLYRIAENPEKQAAAQKVVDQILQEHPEQAELLRQAVSRAGVGR